MDGGAAAKIYEFDGFVVDPVRRTITQGGHPLQLTSKALDTLLFLIEHSGKTVTKRQIMDAVWADTAVEENNLTQQISALRKAFGETPGDHRFIITVPGKGYSFIGGIHRIEPRIRSAAGYSLTTQLIIACAVLLGSLTMAFLTIAASRQSVKPTVAVLAFHSTSGDEDSLGAGLRYTLTAKLGTLRDVIDVRPAGALPHNDPLMAGRELAVDTVVDGTVQHIGEHVRVTIQMIDVRKGRVLWGKSIDAEESQSFAAQDAVADEVVASLEQIYSRS